MIDPNLYASLPKDHKFVKESYLYHELTIEEIAKHICDYFHIPSNNLEQHLPAKKLFCNVAHDNFGYSLDRCGKHINCLRSNASQLRTKFLKKRLKDNNSQEERVYQQVLRKLRIEAAIKREKAKNPQPQKRAEYHALAIENNKVYLATNSKQGILKIPLNLPESTRKEILQKLLLLK